MSDFFSELLAFELTLIDFERPTLFVFNVIKGFALLNPQGASPLDPTRGLRPLDTGNFFTYSGASPLHPTGGSATWTPVGKLIFLKLELCNIFI